MASYKWMMDYLKAADDPASMAKKLTVSGMSVEYMHDLRERYENIVVGVVDSVGDHPNADKLKLVKTNIGTQVVDIVCGGTNLRDGMRVVVALPGSKVVWHGEGEPIVLEKTAVRGVESHGMICATEEIGLGMIPSYDADGKPLIWDITNITDAAAGTPIADALGLDDVLMDIEVTTNRPDAMGMLGLAREAGASMAGEFSFTPPELPPSTEEMSFKVSVKDADLCPRYQGVVMKGVKVGPSPWWMQKRLILAGVKPVNNVVDVTNYLLYEYGRPFHTYDYDKLAGGTLIVRRAKKGERILALDNKTYELTKDHLVIADKNGPVSVAGIMGGHESGVWNETTTIALECAVFDPVTVRRNARDLNLYSDSQHRFEKGLSTESTTSGLARAIELIQEVAGGEVVSTFVDERKEAYTPLQFPFDPEDVNARIGVEIDRDQQVQILTRLGFELQPHGEAFMATVPWWRDHDIETSVDFTEEVARVYGYHNVPATLPTGAWNVSPKDPLLTLIGRVKEELRGMGATELYQYSFASQADLDDWGLGAEDALSFLNPLSEEHQYLRPSIVPTVLRTIEANQGHTPSDLVFELANVYVPQGGQLPLEEPHLVVAGYGEYGQVAIMKGVLDRLMRFLGIEITFDRTLVSDRWHPGRSAALVHDGHILGFFGELAPQVQRTFKLDHRVVALDLHLGHALPYVQFGKRFEALAEFPAVKRDLAIVLDRMVEWKAIQEALQGQHELLESVEPFDVFEGEGIESGKKSLAMHLAFRAKDRTLTAEEVDEALSTVVAILQKTFGATIRS